MASYELRPARRPPPAASHLLVAPQQRHLLAQLVDGRPRRRQLPLHVHPLVAFAREAGNILLWGAAPRSGSLDGEARAESGRTRSDHCCSSANRRSSALTRSSRSVTDVPWGGRRGGAVERGRDSCCTPCPRRPPGPAPHLLAHRQLVLAQRVDQAVQPAQPQLRGRLAAPSSAQHRSPRLSGAQVRGGEVGDARGMRGLRVAAPGLCGGSGGASAAHSSVGSRRRALLPVAAALLARAWCACNGGRWQVSSGHGRAPWVELVG